MQKTHDCVSVTLCDIERDAKAGMSLSPAATLELITLCRQYMAYVEEANRAMENIGALLGECKPGPVL